MKSKTSFETAYCAGYDWGVGVPLLVMGSPLLLLGLSGFVYAGIAAAGSDGMGTGMAMAFGVMGGVGGTVVGGILVGVGGVMVADALGGEPPSNTVQHQAYDAGADVGTGDVLMGVGSIITLVGAALVIDTIQGAVAHPYNAYSGGCCGSSNAGVPWWISVPILLVGAGLLTGGIVLHLEGVQTFDNLDPGGNGSGFFVPLYTGAF